MSTEVGDTSGAVVEELTVTRRQGRAVMKLAWWLNHIFANSPDRDGTVGPRNCPGNVSAIHAVRLTTHIFNHCDTQLCRYTDQQVADGLIFLGASGESDWMCHLYDPAIDWAIRKACIGSIYVLYRDCFSRRCSPMMTQMSGHGLRSMDGVCFMWWDRFPSGWISTTAEAGRAVVDHEIIDVMSQTLELDHEACRESSLHGLGHWEMYDEARVHGIVDDWIARHADVDPNLLWYAREARDGQTQ